MSKFRILTLGAGLLAASLLVACSSDDGTDDEAKLNVVTSVSPITSLVENIG